MQKIKINPLLKTTAFLLLCIISFKSFSQDNTTDEADNPTNNVSKKGFHVGLYVGSLFANKYTANMYDGYGFDVDGNKNNWDNSFMNQKINFEYGGNAYSGQTDQIAAALNVDPHTWVFDESDMPLQMKYIPAFLTGLQCRYSVDNKNAILLNVNAAKLKISGSFNIITTPTSGSTQINQSIKTFGITGGEQRLIFQFGYNHIFGDNENVNFYMEGGLNATLAKFDKNEILINTLHIDLTAYFNQAYYSSAPLVKKPIGIGYGAFAGMGININMSEKWTLQIGYNPSMERINIGENPKIKLQHAFGLRAYLNI